MATSTAMPTSFRESFSTSSMKPFSSVSHSSRWKINNFVAKQKINDKEIMLYLLCSDDLGGDDWKRIWNKEKFKPPYKGLTKLDKRLEANVELIDQFLEMGVPKKQIILTGHSCGGWMKMMLMAKYPDKVCGGIV